MRPGDDVLVPYCPHPIFLISLHCLLPDLRTQASFKMLFCVPQKFMTPRCKGITPSPTPYPYPHARSPVMHPGDDLAVSHCPNRCSPHVPHSHIAGVGCLDLAPRNFFFFPGLTSSLHAYTRSGYDPAMYYSCMGAE
ncbi:hypothetical protein K469DRAFT_162466 [Zopfia rhizophila CBS 207.26]|uniref:Uncharacterized protein n=1 Tax=Zopfia rhizophila CBS 207.26 TaxID=1314779 RepID=A0A6A6E608_9PEZI|nr:hypothetical protein K469DRAFT_162466 [Zopfia rhizophila CBS 207.26]